MDIRVKCTMCSYTWKEPVRITALTLIHKREMKEEIKELKIQLKESKKYSKELEMKLEKKKGLQFCGFCEKEMAPRHWPECEYLKAKPVSVLKKKVEFCGQSRMGGYVDRSSMIDSWLAEDDDDAEPFSYCGTH